MSERKIKNYRKKNKGVHPSPDSMRELFLSCDLSLSEVELDQFWRFHQLLRSRNLECDLTRLHNYESMVFRHYIDSGIIANLIDLPTPLLDLGTGAGFPGVPLKILRPDLEIIFAESRGKKLEFLEESCELLGFENASIYPHKVSDKFDRPVKGVITRDLEAMSKTLARSVGFLPKDGRVIFMKGPSAGPEIEEALREYGSLFEVELDHSYSLGSSGHDRRLVVFRRTSGRTALAGREGGPDYKEVASSQNPGFKLWRKLLEAKGVKKNGLAIMSGLKQVSEMARDFPELCVALLSRGQNDPVVESEVDRFRLKPDLFRELDLFGAGAPLLIVKYPEIKEWADRDWPVGCSLFIPFQDPNNVGAMIRTAAALGCSRVVLLKEAAHPFHPKSLRAAGPAAFRIPLYFGPSINELASDEAPLIALGSGGRNWRGINSRLFSGWLPVWKGRGCRII